MKGTRLPLLLTALVVLAAFVLKLSFFQVRFSEAVVKVRLGKADESSVITKPGFYPRLVWPLETIHKYDIRLKTTELPEIEFTTRDGKNLIVGSYVVWRITDPLNFYIRVKTDREAENQMRSRLNQVRATVIGRQEMSYFVGLDQAAVDQNHSQLEADMLAAAEGELASAYGISVKKIGIRRISLPEQVTQTVFQQMNQTAETDAARYREEGKSIAAAINARAEADARAILAFAEKKAKEVTSTGVQAATRILSQISAQDREFFEYLRWLEALSIALRERSTIFIDAGSPIFRMFREPLLGGASGVGSRPGAAEPSQGH